MKFASALLLLFAAGCSSVSVDPDSMMLMRNFHAPENIYVQPFNTTMGEWTSFEGKAPDEFKQSQNALLTKQLIDALEQIAPSQAAPNPLPGKGLMVTGEFIKVDPEQGKVLTKVMVFDLERMKVGPVASFQPEASGSLEAAWRQTAAATVEWLDRKMDRHGAGMSSPHQKRVKKERQQQQ